MVSETLLTFVLTILGGVSIYVIGQIVMKFLIEPVHELLHEIGRIGYILIRFANVYTNTGLGKRHQVANRNLRMHSSLLRSKTHLIKWHCLFSMVRVVPSKEDIQKASSLLIGISNLTPRNSHDCVTNLRKQQQIEELLKLKS